MIVAGVLGIDNAGEAGYPPVDYRGARIRVAEGGRLGELAAGKTLAGDRRDYLSARDSCLPLRV